MKFDPDSEYQKHRDANGGVWFIQNGQKFTVRGKKLGPVDSELQTQKDERKKQKKAIRDRATKKLADYSGSDASGGSIAAALKENREAKAAEERTG